MILSFDVEQSVRYAVDESIREVFSMMLNRSIECGTVEESVAASQNSAITVLLGLTGEIQGSLSLTLTEKAAIDWTRELINEDITEMDENVSDAVGELGNLVVGGAKRRLEDFGLSMSLPTVLRAGNSSLIFPKHSKPFEIVYCFNCQPLTVIVAMSQGT